LRTVTPCRVAVVPGDRVNRQVLEELAENRRLDSTAPGGSNAESESA
jgi:hypothetical protein